MRLIATAVLSLLIPVQAMALSCVRPSVERSYGYAEASDVAHVVVEGVLKFDANALPKRDLSDNDVKTAQLEAKLTGTSMSKAGFLAHFAHDITLSLECAGPWCATAESGAEILAFVERSDAGYTLRLGPCGGTAFFDPTAEMKAKALACFRGQSCKP